MKKYILTTFALLFFIITSAQDKNTVGFYKGNIVASGSLGLLNSSGSSGSSVNTFVPSLVYFTSEKISVGFNTSINDGDINGYGVSTSYHFNPANQFSSQLGFHLNLDKVAGTTTTAEIKYTINYFISKKLFLSTSITGLKHEIKNPDIGPDLDTTTLGLNTENISFNIGYKF